MRPPRVAGTRRGDASLPTGGRAAVARAVGVRLRLGVNRARDPAAAHVSRRTSRFGETGAVPQLQPVDETFFASAPSRASETFAIPRPAAEVWAGLTADDPLAWCRPIKGRWTSDRPFGVGTTRRMKVLGGAITVREHFFVWEEGRRKAFYVTSANLPLFRRLAEDYVVEPDGDDACRFTWTIAYETTLAGRAGGPVNKALFSWLFADTRKHFAAR